MAGRGVRVWLPSPGKSHRSVRLISLWGLPVDEILSRAGIFQGVEPSAVSALTKQFQRVDFPRGHTVFGQGEPGDRLYIIVSGQVKIGIRSSGPAAAPADRKVPGTVSGSKHGRLSPISRSTTKPRAKADRLPSFSASFWESPHPKLETPVMNAPPSPHDRLHVPHSPPAPAIGPDERCGRSTPA